MPCPRSRRAGLKYKIYNVYSPEPANTVIAESPKPGLKVKKGSTIRINVSKGLKPVDLPDVTTELFPDAEATLKGLKFVVVRTNVQDPSVEGHRHLREPAGWNPAAGRLDGHPDRLERAGHDPGA